MNIKRLLFIPLVALFLLNSLGATQTYTVGFYTDFEPISYAESREPGTEGFDSARGMEPALLRAIEEIPNSNLRFEFKGIKTWDQIWMAPASTEGIDIVVGGITKEKIRMIDSSGREIIQFTHPTVQFKQSLLILAEHKEKITTHKDLNCGDIVGAVPGTTGEYRFLVQSGIINNLTEGFIQQGVSVILPDHGYIRSDGKLSIYDPRLKNRQFLVPGDCSLPLVRYFIGEDEMIPSLLEKHITAIGRGYIGNSLIAGRYPTDLFVTAVYSLEGGSEETEHNTLPENAGFAVRIEDEKLLEELNIYIDFLTDNGRIGYKEWKENPAIFTERAKTFSK